MAMVPQPITPTLIMGKLLSFVPRLAGRLDKMILAYPVDENKMRILDGKCKKEGAEAPTHSLSKKAFRQAPDASQLKQTCIGNVIFL